MAPTEPAPEPREGAGNPADPGGEIPAPAEPIPVPAAERRFFTSPQLFIFPLVLVTVGATIYALFEATTADRRPVSDLITEIQGSVFAQSRDRTAYELAMRAQELVEDGKKLSAEDTRRLIDTLRQAGADGRFRQWLIFALGRAGEESQALPELLGMLSAESPLGLEGRVYAIQGLGLSGSAAVVEPLLAQLAGFQAEDQHEPRLITLSSLANVAFAIEEEHRRLQEKDKNLSGERPEPVQKVLAALRRHLDDPHWTVAWNAAAILGTRFKDRSGVKILRGLLDRERLAKYVTEPKHQDEWIVLAIEALEALEDAESYPLLEPLARERSFKVRKAALLILNKRKT